MLPLHNAVCDRPYRRCVAPGVSHGHAARSAAGQVQPVYIIIFLQVFWMLFLVTDVNYW